MRCLLIYYSFTEQAGRAVELASRECRNLGWEPVLCRVDFSDPDLRLTRPMSLANIKRWTTAAKNEEIFDIQITPENVLDTDYDLVGIFSNTWQHHPCVPIRSLLADSRMQRLLEGTPFAVYVICRRIWEKNLDIVRGLGEAAGGNFLAGHAFIHSGSGLGSLIQTVTYLRRNDAGRQRFLGFPLPSFGLSAESMAAIEPFTASMLKAVEGHSEDVA